LPPDYQQQDTGAPSDIDLSPAYFNAPLYEGEESYNVSRASLELQRKCWTGLDTAIPKFVQALRENTNSPPQWVQLGRKVSSRPTCLSVGAATANMRAAMVEADTVIGYKQFNALVSKHTKNEDERRAVAWHHEQVTQNSYNTRWTAREIELIRLRQ
jgi:hypothetical protein